MFKRVTYEGWHDFLTILSLAIFLIGFIYLVYRVIRMKKTKVQHMSELPLEEEQSSATESTQQAKR